VPIEEEEEDIFTFNINWHVAAIFSIFKLEINKKIVVRCNFLPPVLLF
jgi:hypothetical protein